MGKFDPIDIFFIALISAYFVTLICIGITFLFIRLKIRKSSTVGIEPVKFKEEKVKRKKVKFSFKDKLASIPLFRKLFMKEVNQSSKGVETKVLGVEKVKVEKTEKLAPPIVKDEKKTASSKPKTSMTKKTSTKKTGASSKPKTTAKTSASKKTTTSKSSTNKSSTSKKGNKKTTSSKSSTKKNTAKKKSNTSKKRTNKKKKK